MKPPVERTRKRTPPRALTADPAASETSRPRDARGPPLQEAARYAALEPLSEVNECCLELLVQDARSARPGAFPLTVHLRELLSGLSPEIRTRAGRRSLLLVDLELSNVTWWQRLIEHPTRPPPVPPWRGGFPKARGVLLTRATLVVAWHSLRSDPSAGCPMGMAPAVAPLIAGLTLSEIEQIAERRCRWLRPRWEDQPAVWRQLLRSAQSADTRSARDFNLRGLQLLTGDLL
jgi:hypothetical protein